MPKTTPYMHIKTTQYMLFVKALFSVSSSSSIVLKPSLPKAGRLATGPIRIVPGQRGGNRIYREDKEQERQFFFIEIYQDQVEGGKKKGMALKG